MEDLMLRISAFHKQHMQLTYLALTFAIAWGSILLVVGRGGFAVNGEQSERLFILIYDVFGDAHVRESHRVLEDSYAPGSIRIDSCDILLDIHHCDVDHHRSGADAANFSSTPAWLTRKETHYAQHL